MRFELNIDYPEEKMELSRQRMEARLQFQYVDRAPVNYCVVPRFFAPVFGLPYLDFFRDAETQYYWLLQFAKYQIENIPGDYCTGPVVYVHPYFDNVVPPSAYGAEIGWTPDSPPRAIPIIHTVEEMVQFEAPQPDAGLRGKTIEWWLEMKELAGQTRLLFNGREGRVDVAPLGSNYLSPHMIAVDLVGTDFYAWMLEYPEESREFLRKIALIEIEAEEFGRRIDPRDRGQVYGLAEDSGTILSPKTFREFCIPYTGMVFERFGAGLKFGRGIHMCGDSTHLLPTLKKDLGMTHFDIFGYMVSPQTAAEKLGGTTLLWGNLNPMLMKDGSPQEVKQAALHCLEGMAPCGGFMLGDGANICPGTPLESFAAVMEAAEEYGLGGK
jgi:uroporphyrinogen-III decarboxylase